MSVLLSHLPICKVYEGERCCTPLTSEVWSCFFLSSRVCEDVVQNECLKLLINYKPDQVQFLWWTPYHENLCIHKWWCLRSKDECQMPNLLKSYFGGGGVIVFPNISRSDKTTRNAKCYRLTFKTVQFGWEGWSKRLTCRSRIKFAKFSWKMSQNPS